ncbi:MAG: PQQ-binding-like beta-propeller repeat protein [Thermotogae bacterium]|nr:PQQ-binding-like beta-propeller repeat protein [Thermotogota bacterium]
MWLIFGAINYYWKTYAGDETQQGVQGLPATITAPDFLWETDLGVSAGIPHAIWGSPTICNLSSTEPGNEVLIKANPPLSTSTDLHALRGTDGSSLWTLSSFGQDPSSPACGDIDGDGLDEVVTRTFSDGLKAIDGDGTVLWTNSDPGYAFSSPVVIDVDPSSPGPEILVTGPSGSSAQLWIISSSGTTLRTVSISIVEQPAGTPAVGDVDGDGRREIIVPTLWSGLKAIDPVAGSVEWTVPGLAMNQTPAVIDADGDGNLDVVYAYEGQYIQIARGSDGSSLWSLPFDVNAHTTVADTHAILMEHFAVWDIDGNGYVDILFGDGGDSSSVASHLLRVAATSSGGNLEWLYSIPQWSYDGGGVLVDVDNDGDWDFVKTDDAGYLYALDANSGTLVWRLSVDDLSTTLDPAVAVGDVDGDNCSEIVVLGYTSSFLGGNLVARAIDQSGGGGSGCTPLSWEDPTDVGERTAPDGSMIVWKDGTLYAAVDLKAYRANGTLAGRFSKGEAIRLPAGVYYLTHHGKVKRVIVR